jgi:hypothetical protein
LSAWHNHAKQRHFIQHHGSKYSGKLHNKLPDILNQRLSWGGSPQHELQASGREAISFVKNIFYILDII